VQGNWVQVYVGVLIVAAAAIEPHLRPDGAVASWLRGRIRAERPA
jgi:ribose transport system permease protein